MTRALGFLLVVAWACDAATAKEPSGDDRAKSASTPPVRSMSAPKRVWEVSFPTEISMDEYARQLDFFKIEIAAISKNGKVEYIREVSKRKPEKRVGRLEQDYRFKIPWKSGTLHAVDRKLLRKAGISSTRKELLHFFPIETQALMKQVERGYAKRDPRAIKRTRFEIRAGKSGGYEFVVVEQDPPRPAEADRPAASSSRNTP